MMQTDQMLQMSKARIERLQRDAALLREIRGGARRRPLRRQLARLLHSWARSLDPSLSGEIRRHPAL